MTSTALGDLDSLIGEAMEEWQVPGLALAVVVDGEPALFKVYGQRDVEAGLPVTIDTQFTLCSITKSFTAAGLGILVDERRLDWTKPVREYIPEFRLNDPIASDRITVQDLLCHHSGLPRHDWVWMPGDQSREQMLDALPHLEPSQDIRASFQYSNLGYMVSGMVAERVTGMSWEDFTLARIMTPLGMTHVGFSSEDLERATDSARPYIMADDEPGVYLRRRAPLWPIRDTPAGGINAAISDLAKYVQFYRPTAAARAHNSCLQRRFAQCRHHAFMSAGPSSPRSVTTITGSALDATIIAARASSATVAAGSVGAR